MSSSSVRLHLVSLHVFLILGMTSSMVQFEPRVNRQVVLGQGYFIRVHLSPFVSYLRFLPQ